MVRVETGEGENECIASMHLFTHGTTSASGVTIVTFVKECISNKCPPSFHSILLGMGVGVLQIHSFTYNPLPTLMKVGLG